MSKAENKSNMYKDSVKQWNCFVGCYFDCIYCKKSFKAQMRRQIHNCELCGKYIPHFHEDRLKKSLPKTHGDEFIWACSSSDIYFAKKEWIEKILEVVRKYNDRTFFFQSKAPSVFGKFNFPDNVILGTTLESNRDYPLVSKAPLCKQRALEFAEINHSRKVVTIEPILQFDLYSFLLMIKSISPERVYIGYNTRKSDLPEPRMAQTKALLKMLEKFTKVKLKYMKEGEVKR